MGYIYKITNDVNGKMYIGKTEYVNPEKGWKEHLKDYKRRKNEKRPLYAAMKKYGEEHFYFEIIEKSDNTEERENIGLKNFAHMLDSKIVMDIMQLLVEMVGLI